MNCQPRALEGVGCIIMWKIENGGGGGVKTSGKWKLGGQNKWIVKIGGKKMCKVENGGGGGG